MQAPEIAYWEHIAQEYNELIKRKDVLRVELLNRAVFGLCGNLTNKIVLDAGCGQGYLSYELVNRGADVVGIDGSTTLIKFAVQNYTKKGFALQYFVHDLTKPLRFSNATFDIVVCNMVLMDFNPLESAMKEFQRVLKLGGSFIFSIPHPAFFAGRLEKTLKERLLHKPPHYSLSRYHMPFKRMHTIVGTTHETPYYHRPLEYYFTLLKNNSLCIVDLQEPVLSKEKMKQANNFLKLCTEIPMFVIIKAVKYV